MNGMQCLSFLFYLNNRKCYFLFFNKMNNKLSRICESEIKEFKICTKYGFGITIICNCCKNIFDVQTPVYGVHNGL